MDSNAYGFYTKRFEVQESHKKELQSELESTRHDHTSRSNANHALAERSQPEVEKEHTRTLTQLENVKANDKENYPNHFLVVEGEEPNGKKGIIVDGSQQSLDGRVSRPSEIKKRPLQCLESLAKCAGDSAAEYEAASVLLTLDKQNNSAVVRPKTKGTDIKSDIVSVHQDKGNHKVKVESGQQSFKGQEQSVSSQSAINPNINYLSLQGQPLFQNQPLLQVVNKPEQRNSRVNIIVSTMTNEIKPQQMVVENGAQTQMNVHHEQQHHQTVAVVSSIPNSMPTHQVAQASVTAMQQQNTTTLAPMQSLHTIQSNAQQQIGADWGSGRVQVIQQPLQNNSYLQQLYNTQGPLLMPGNIALHPGINSQQIQVITAGKAFQGNQLAPHMLTQGKQVLQGQAGAFPGYTIPTSQNQTFVFSPLNVLNNQPSILPTHSQAAVSTINQPQKPGDIQKAINSGKLSAAKNPPTATVQTQCVQVSQPVLHPTPQPHIISPLQTGGQTMQFAPWQISGALPQVWTGGLQAGALSAGGLLAPNPIFLRAPQPEAPPMFIQHSPQNNLQNTSTNVTCQSASKPRPSAETTVKTHRSLSSILPSTGIRPASSVSTQTGNNRQMIKYRNKLDNVLRASPAPATKQDAANQTNKTQLTSTSKTQTVVSSNAQTTTTQEKHQTNKSVQPQPAIIQQPIQQQLQQQQVQLQQQSSQQQIVQHFPQAITTMQHAAVNQTIPMAAMPQTISMVPQLHSLTGMAAGTALVQPTAAGPITQLHTMPAQPQALMQGSLVQTSAGMTVQNPAPFSHTAPIHTTGLQALDGTALMAASPLVQLLSQEMSGNTLASSQLTLQGASMGLVAQPIQATVMNALPMSQAQPIIAQIKPNEEKVESTVVSSVVPVQTTTPQVVAADTLSITSSAASTVASTAASTAASVAACSVASSVTSSTTSVPESKVTTSVTFTVTAPVVTVSTATDTAKVTPKSVSPATIKNEAESGEPSTVTSSASRPSTPTSTVTTVSTATSVTTTTVTRSPATTAASSSTSVKTLAINGRSNSMSNVTPDKSLPKAMIRPILTHVIEGYVIQEAAEPFAVNRPFRDWSADKAAQEGTSQSEEPPRKKALLESMAASSATESEELDTTTEPRTPGSVKSETTSTASTSSMGEEEQMADIAMNERPNVRQWTMMDVHEFIRNIPGGAEYADDFLAQEVDGLALLLIRPEHLVMALSMKLGPALKIVAGINAIRPDSEDDDNSD